MYEVSYVWKESKNSEIEHYTFVGIYSKKKRAERMAAELKKRKRADGKKGKIYLKKIKTNKGEWEEGFFTDTRTELDLPYWMMKE